MLASADGWIYFRDSHFAKWRMKSIVPFLILNLFVSPVFSQNLNITSEVTAGDCLGNMGNCNSLYFRVPGARCFYLRTSI